MTQTTTSAISSNLASPAIASVTTTVDDAILVTGWSTPITVTDDAYYTATPAASGTVLVQFSNDSGSSWFPAANSPYRTTSTNGVPTGVNQIRAMATGGTATLTVITPVAGNVQRAAATGYAPVGVLARSAVAVPLTNTLSLTILASVTIPANLLGPNGGIRVTIVSSETNNVNTKTIIARINSTSHYQASLASVLGRRIQYECWNRGATGSQLNFGTSIGTSIGTFTQPFITTSFDTTTDNTFQIIGQLTNVADTFTLEAWMVEYFYGA